MRLNIRQRISNLEFRVSALESTLPGLATREQLNDVANDVLDLKRMMRVLIARQNDESSS